MQTDSKPLLNAKQKPKANRRSVKLPSKRFVSVYGGFPSRWLLWTVIGSSPLQTEEKRHRTPDCRLGRRKVQLKHKFCVVFQHSFADKFSVSCTFFRHEQHVSLRLPLSLLSEIIVSWTKQFCTPKMIISHRYISVTDVADLQNVQLLSLGTTHWFDLGINSCNTFQKSRLFSLASHCANSNVSWP